MGKILTEVMITGGSAAGKTSAQQRVKEWGLDKPFRVLSAPETASIVIEHALPDIATVKDDQPSAFYAAEVAMYNLHVHFREELHRMAEGFEEDVVIFYDRGELDVATYLPEHVFQGVLRNHQRTPSAIRGSYDLIIHLESSAVRVPHYYNYKNPARWETVDQAKDFDQRILTAWTCAHQHLVVGRDSFEDKMTEMLRIIEHHIENVD